MSGLEDIGKMIDESVEDIKREEEVDEAVDKLARPDDAARQANKLATLGAEFAQKVQIAFEKKSGAAALKDLAKEFLSEAKTLGKTEDEATEVLMAQLREYHDSYQAAGLKEKAAEIDAFARSLESKAEVSTPAGKEFLVGLDAGKYSSLEEAINALNDIKDKAKGVDADKMNAEFNVLYGEINKRFLSGTKEKGKGLDVGDEDIDAMLGGL